MDPPVFHWTDTNSSEVPSGFTLEDTLGELLGNPGPSLLAVYICSDGGPGNFMSTDQSGQYGGATPGGSAPTDLGIDGHLYGSAPTNGTNTVELLDCLSKPRTTS